jgi:autotransporter-associated beta strand protein
MSIATLLRRVSFACIVLIAIPLAATTRTWTGTNSGAWSDGGNWGGTAPVPGDDLVFPTGAANQTNSNDFAAGTSFNSIAITGGTYTLNGNAITLGAGGLSVATSGNTINLPITLGAAQQWSTTTGSADFTIAGNVNLNGFALTLSITGSSSTISGVISGSGQIIKNAAGPITFSGNNSYSGITTLNQGYLIVSNANGLGVEDGTPANGTVVNSGASLSLLNVVLGNEHVSATGQGQSANGALQNDACGNGTFTGPIVVSGAVKFSACGPGGSLSFNGPISGSPTQLDLFGTSPFFFNAVNTVSGPVFIDNSGFPNVVNIGVNNAFSAVSIDVDVNETLKLNNFNDQISSVSGSGNIDLGSGTLTVVGTQVGFAFKGVISGTGNLFVSSPSVFELFGSNSIATGTLKHTGPGDLVVFGGTWPGPVLLTGGFTIFTNNPVVGPVTVNSGAQVLFGSAGVPNTTSGNLTMAAGSTFSVFFINSAPGGYSRLTLNGTANLGGATLNSAIAVFPPGTQFTVIDNDGNDPVTGTFAGVPEGGTIISSQNGQPYRVTYIGGDGNDVVLTALAFPTTTSLMSSLNPSIAGQLVTFTATVSPNGGSSTPTGTVTFFDGATPLGTGTLNGSGVATFGTTALSAGPHSITAVYAGDANFAGSSSAALVQNVTSIVAIPALDPRALLALALGLAMGGALLLRR